MARPSVKLLCLIACMPVTFFLTCPVSATELYVPALKAKSGESIDIPIMIDQVDNLAGLKLVMKYDPKILTFKKGDPFPFHSGSQAFQSADKGGGNNEISIWYI